jgi:hypothetical protein
VKAFGASIVNRTSEGAPPGGSGKTCTWAGGAVGSFTSAHSTLRVIVVQISEKRFEKNAKETPRAVRQRGIGEAAYSDGTAGLLWLNAWRKGIALTINLSLETTAPPLQVAKTLAKAALQRI